MRLPSVRLVVKLARGLGIEREMLITRFEDGHAAFAHFKAPHSVTFIKEFPKTATGKIQKYVLRARPSAIAAQ